VKSEKISSLGSFTWSIAEILRGDFKQSEYGKVILPFVVMRRLDCILEASKTAVLEAAEGLPAGVDDATRDMILFGAIGGNVKIYNLSRFTFKTLHGQDPGQLHQNLIDYITNSRLTSATSFSTNFCLPINSSASKKVASSGRCSTGSARSISTRSASRTSRWAICSRI
jgi:type I restriction-modification system DNA methylase subunit